MRKQARDNRKGRVRETRGRKILLTPALQAELKQILEEGHYQSVACSIVGISEHTYYNWLNAGGAAEIKKESGENLSDPEEKYLQFFHAVKKAKAKGIRHDINIISKIGMEQDWRALAWKRERMNPELFALRGRVDVDCRSKIEQKVAFDKKQVEELILSMPEEELLRIVRDAKRVGHVELSDANTGTVLDIMAECGAIPPPAPGLEHRKNEKE